MYAGRSWEGDCAETRKTARAQLEDGAVPLHGLPFAGTQDEPWCSQHRPTGASDKPPPVHAQVATNDQPAFEREQEVLASDLDMFESSSVDPGSYAERSGAGMRRFGLDNLALERP